MNEIAIVVIAYNRIESLTRLLTSLNNIVTDNNSKITLHISIDRNKSNEKSNIEIYNYAKKFNWKYGTKIVDYKSENLGLKKHVIECGKLTNKYNNIIVLEDDLVVSPLIYIYAKQVLDFYKDENIIAGFGLYSFQRNPLNNLPFFSLNNGLDVYFMQYACSWGQMWTKKQWNNFYEWYIKNQNTDFSKDYRIPNNIKSWGEKSWLKYYEIYTILENKYFVYPQYGLTTNFTDVGTHNYKKSFAYQCNMLYNVNNDIKFKFTNFAKAKNVYDAFFENIYLKDLIKSTENFIISDFYGDKPIELINQYNVQLLSTKKYDYKIIKSYSLSMYPYELNVINDIEGNDIYLYDTSIIKNNNMKKKSSILLTYVYKLDLLSKKNMLRIIMCFLKDFCERVKNKIKRK